MIQDVEELRAELHIESLRDFRDVRVLEYREINCSESRPIQTVASRVTHEILAVLCTCGGCGRTGKGIGRASNERGRLSRQRETVYVEVVNASLDGIASLGDIWEVHGKVPVKPGAKRIAPRSKSCCKW